jgi:hypothetical protein
VSRTPKTQDASHDPAPIEPTRRHNPALVAHSAASSMTSTGGWSASSSRTPTTRTVLWQVKV